MTALEKGILEGIVSATRMHFPPECSEIPEVTQRNLRAYAVNTHELGLVAAIAVNSHAETVKSIAQSAAPGLKVHVLPVPEWGAFVAALNALLSFAQRSGMRHILYQSLEVQCSEVVLESLLNHFDSDVLVTGPVLAGHTYSEGEQKLNGRTTPWNTLALWSVRKLALTGFPRIADGITQEKAPENTGQVDSGDEKDSSAYASLLGSNDWWSKQVEDEHCKDIPAGVEEVTAIALLQHLLGRHRAIAVLVKLPDSVQKTVSWETDWGKDEKRKQWHEYKMKTKVTRPNAQLKELFPVEEAKPICGGRDDTPLNYGTVMHVGSSILPPRNVEFTCLAAVGMFYFNSTAVLASAFHRINSRTESLSVAMMVFICFIIGGVYVLMPVSLQLTRLMTQHYGHMSGFLFFGSILLLSHLCIISSQLFCSEATHSSVLLMARIAQGLGSGVCFQSRFVLASLSTSDQHAKLQARVFFGGDLGLGLGALLPTAISAIGFYEFPWVTPELWPSVVQSMIYSAFLVWVLIAFPRYIHLLPERVRFAPTHDEPEEEDPFSPKGDFVRQTSLAKQFDDGREEAAKFRKVLLISGTARVFVQSAIMPFVALVMFDAGWTGQFRQCIAVAALYLLQLPFEVMSSTICCACPKRSSAKDGMHFGRLLFGSSTVVSLVLGARCLNVAGFSVSQADSQLLRHLAEMAGLIVMLAVAAPSNASRLYQLQNAEQTIVVLEWLKAYVGRLLAPFVSVVIYTYVGHGALLSCLSLATLVVVFTA